MTQNISTAVMQQRHEPHDSLDFFPTPPWATRALVEHVLAGHGWRLDQFGQMTVWDPCCGRGHMVRPLADYFGGVFGSDIHAYGDDTVLHDFLMPGKTPFGNADFIVINPPFRLALEFIVKAQAIAREAVCVLVRTSFLEGVGRYRDLFARHRPLFVAPFVERVVMAKGRCIDPDAKYWNEEAGEYRRISSATSYCWLVFPGWCRQRITREAACLWIPPARKALERPGDYDDPAETGPAPGPAADATRGLI